MKIRRDKLFRLAQAGKLVAVASYHYDEMTGESRSDGVRFPVRIIENGNEFKEGWYNLRRFDFESSCGSASLSTDGMIAHLYVHSNCNYGFRMADGSAFTGNGKTAMRGKRPENVRMQNFLAANGIKATVKYLPDGSLRGCWRLSDTDQPWTMELAGKLNALGFTDFDLKPLGQFSGNGGVFSCFVRGHNELLQEPVNA